MIEFIIGLACIAIIIVFAYYVGRWLFLAFGEPKEKLDSDNSMKLAVTLLGLTVLCLFGSLVFRVAPEIGRHVIEVMK